MSHLHDPANFLAYCCILEKCSIDTFTLPACNYMCVRTFQFLLGQYSQPLVYMLHHLLIVFKEMSSIIANRN